MKFHPIAAICLGILFCSVVVLLAYVRHLRGLIEEASNAAHMRIDDALKEQAEAVQRIQNLETDLSAVSKSRDRLDLLHADLVRTVGVSSQRIDTLFLNLDREIATAVEPVETRISALESHQTNLTEIAAICTLQEIPERLAELERSVAQSINAKLERKDPAGAPLRSFADQRKRFESKVGGSV